MLIAIANQALVLTLNNVHVMQNKLTETGISYRVKYWHKLEKMWLITLLNSSKYNDYRQIWFEDARKRYEKELKWR